MQNIRPPNGNNGHSPRTPRRPTPAEPELIVIASPSAGLRARAAAAPESVTGVDVSDLAAVLESAQASLQPLFGPSEEHLNLRAAAPGLESLMPQNLGAFYRVAVESPQLEELREMAKKLIALPSVEAAYVKAGAMPAMAEELNTMTPRSEDVPPATPDFAARQGYLGAAPAGVEALFARTVPGGRGANVRVIDIEGSWRFSHEDMSANQGGLAGGTESTDIGWRNHGTAVLGEIGGDENSFGVTGIAPDANVRGISIFGGLGSAGAIRRAADLLQPGDVILLELHRPGPRATGVGQVGFIAIEWWPDDFAAIRYAIARGVIVVEAAGNGAEDLDHPAYDVPDPGFPATWRNPFRRGSEDSGAILVGAGAPPPGTHGRDHGPDRSRLDFSNFGSAVDAQGWGREVTTCGYGDLQGGPNEDIWYTDQFSGTSSASPIVTAALACIQGVRRARGLPVLTPPGARALLRSTGSPQVDAPRRPATQRIGNRPDVRQMIAQLQPVTPRAVPLHRYYNASIGDHFYTTDWAELEGGRYGWGYEGVQCYVYASQVPGTAPLYRYFNPAIGDHFYTTDWAELEGGRYGWSYEGVQCYVHGGPATGATGLYRYWNPDVGDHFYTTNWAELGNGRLGYLLEGVQCYVQLAASVAVPIQAPVMMHQAAGASAQHPFQSPFQEGAVQSYPLGSFANGAAHGPSPAIPDSFAHPQQTNGWPAAPNGGAAAPERIAAHSPYSFGAGPDRALSFSIRDPDGGGLAPTSGRTVTPSRLAANPRRGNVIFDIRLGDQSAE